MRSTLSNRSSSSPDDSFEMIERAPSSGPIYRSAPGAVRGNAPVYYQAPAAGYAPHVYEVDYQFYRERRPRRKPIHWGKLVVGGLALAVAIVGTIWAYRRYRGTFITINPMINGKPGKKTSIIHIGVPFEDAQYGMPAEIDVIALAPFPVRRHVEWKAPPTGINPTETPPPGFSTGAAAANRQGPMMNSSASSMQPDVGSGYFQSKGIPEPMADTSMMEDIVSRTHG